MDSVCVICRLHQPSIGRFDLSTTKDVAQNKRMLGNGHRRLDHRFFAFFCVGSAYRDCIRSMTINGPTKSTGCAGAMPSPKGWACKNLQTTWPLSLRSRDHGTHNSDVDFPRRCHAPRPQVVGMPQETSKHQNAAKTTISTRACTMPQPKFLGTSESPNNMATLAALARPWHPHSHYPLLMAPALVTPAKQTPPNRLIRMLALVTEGRTDYSFSDANNFACHTSACTTSPTDLKCSINRLPCRSRGI